ncbi:uncharacterized protein JCM10292_004778 [Rhodotorula paludigena]|uniref:uncharacterized protein n=1 Tax=Rhodotorula paludigena TaxID=86838 RepID=UPI00318175E3
MARTIAVVGATALHASCSSAMLRRLRRGDSSCDLNDPKSLAKALESVNGLFAAFADSPNQVEQGKNLVDAAKRSRTSSYSSLPSISKLSGGAYTRAAAFDAKEAVAEYAKEQLAAVTLVMAGAFYSNLRSAFYARRLEDGTVRFCVPIKPTSAMQWVDERHDVGVFAATIFSAPLDRVKGKTYPIMAEPRTLAETANEYEQATGEKAIGEPLSMAEALEGILVEQHEMWRQMYGWHDNKPVGTVCYGLFKPSEDRSWEDLGVKASSFDEFLNRTGFRVQ